MFLIIYAFFVFYYPNYLGHTDNYIPADPLVTPAEIVPEWYFPAVLCDPALGRRLLVPAGQAAGRRRNGIGGNDPVRAALA